MSVRKLQRDDVGLVSQMVNSAFQCTVASGLSVEGVVTFSDLAAAESFTARMNDDNLMLVYESNGGIVGMVELKEGRHVAMLFVLPAAQRQGIGRALVEEALSHAREKTVTVSASIPSVPAYEAYGFKIVGPNEEKQGLRYVPMEIELNE